MPATQRGQAYKISSGKWGLRYYDHDGTRKRESPFPSKSAALAHYRDVIEPRLRGDAPAETDTTLSEFTALWLELHSANVRPRTISSLRERPSHAEKVFGDVPLRDLANMSAEIAAWRARQPERVRYGRTGALRQCLEAATRWNRIARNPAKLAGRNRQPSPRVVRVYTLTELDTVALELAPQYEPLPAFAAATGLRPEEWGALERRDIDRSAGLLTVSRTISSGEVVELGKTTRSRRQVPLSPRALAALDRLPARLSTPLLFSSPSGDLINLDNFRHRQWAPAIEAGGIAKPARIYDLRSTFASNALSAGVSVFELARIMGTSVQMIERSYGVLLDGAGAGIANRLAAMEADQERDANQAAQDV